MSRSEVEFWLWFGIVVSIVVLRFVARVLFLRSIKKAFQLEDYATTVTVIFYISLLTLIKISSHYPTNLVAPDLLDKIQPDEVPRRIIGSKLVIVVEQLWCATIWGCKACLLLQYYSMTGGLKERKLVKAVASCIAFGYMVMEIFFFGIWCTPFHNYWSVPSANFQCDTYHGHLILNLIVNVSSDLAMLWIPFPILLRAQLPPRKKIILCCLFGVGGFVIICASLSKFYSLNKPYGTEWMDWYVREVSVAVIVANIPHCWFLIRKMFKLDRFLQNGWDGRQSRRWPPTLSPNDNTVVTNASSRKKTRKRLTKRMQKSGVPTSSSQEHFVEYQKEAVNESGIRLKVLEDRYITGTEFHADDEIEGDVPIPINSDAAFFV